MLWSLFTWPRTGSLPTERGIWAYAAVYHHIYTTFDINFISCFYWPTLRFWSQFSKPVRGRCAPMSLLNGRILPSSQRAQPRSITLMSRAQNPTTFSCILTENPCLPLLVTAEIFSPHLPWAPYWQKPLWISNLTPPGRVCLEGRNISLLNESLNCCHFSLKKSSWNNSVFFGREMEVQKWILHHLITSLLRNLVS